MFENFRDDNFHKWFYGSKVVDSNNKPLEVYHDSSEEFQEFYHSSYFTDDWYNTEGYASGEYVYDVFLSIKNPLIVNANGKKWDEIESEYGSSTKEIVDNVDKNKFDGVIIKNVNDWWWDDGDFGEPINIYIPFQPNQIKSSDNNNGKYSTSSNIYH